MAFGEAPAALYVTGYGFRFLMRKKLGKATGLVSTAEPPALPGRILLDIRFPADTTYKTNVLDQFLHILSANGAWNAGDSAAEARVRLCLDEGLVNAIMHGSKGDTSKNVRAVTAMSSSEWTVQIEDEGVGFREEDLPDPDAPENLLEEGGRGVHLMRTLMTEARYYRGGRVLRLTQKFTT
jgi:serine/threonine-protein kinase RsbW